MNLVRKVKQAKRSNASFAESDNGTDVLETLKKEHEEVAELLGQLVESDSRAERRSLLKQIKSALIPHLRAEEKAVYDAVLAEKDMKLKIDGEEGYLEHDIATKTVMALGKISNPMSPEFSAGAKVLKELVEHHVEEEENNIWSDLRENFSEEDRMEMNRKFEAAKKKVRVS